MLLYVHVRSTYDALARGVSESASAAPWLASIQLRDRAKSMSTYVVPNYSVEGR